ncbi:MAG: ABC transporter permease [Acidimicrobiales bacterium]
MSQVQEGAPGASLLAAEGGVGTTAGEVLLDARPRRRSWWVPVLAYLVTVFVLVTFNFALPRLIPGSPIDAMFASGSPDFVDDAQAREQLAEYYGLDKPVLEQYVDYLGGLVRGDLGTSIDTNQPVSKELWPRIGWSLLLIGASTIVAVLIALPLGIHSGWRRGRRSDRAMLGFFISVQNVPIYVLGFVAVVVLSAKLGIFPLFGASTANNDYDGIRQVLDVAWHLALPALLMGFFDFAAYEYLVMRSSMVGELGSDYLLGGRAKGLRERRLKYGYAGRNALLPVVTVVGLQFGLAIATIVFVERIFVYPGVGGYMFGAIGQRDYPAIQGAFLVLTVAVVTTNLIVDLLYRRLDPRVSR